jgi:hypothetical protein
VFVWGEVRGFEKRSVVEASSMFGYYKMYGKGKGKFHARKVQRQTSRHDLVKDTKGGEEERRIENLRRSRNGRTLR